MKHLRLEQSFSGHQKVMLGLFVIFFTVIASTELIVLSFDLIAFFKALTFVLCTLLLIGFIFMQNGFTSLGNDRVARGWYIYGLPVRLQKIDATLFPVISILTMGKSQKLAWTVAANPDLAVGYNSYDITSLSENHTKKERLIILKEKENALNAMAFIVGHSTLREEMYSPDFSK